jgi:hypothetical protein
LHPFFKTYRNISMKNKNIITTISAIEPPMHLKGVILARIEREGRKRQMRRKMLLMGGFMVSGIGAISSLAFFGREILASDFWSIASLAFSDLGTVVGHWQDYAFSLLETLPVVSIIAILVPIVAMLLLTKYYANHIFNFNNKVTA